MIAERLTCANRFACDEGGGIVDYGIPPERLEEAVNSGEPFRTSGCQGYDGQVACNRPFANSRPGTEIRNYPVPPDRDDIARIRRQMGLGEEVDVDIMGKRPSTDLGVSHTTSAGEGENNL